MTSPTPFPLVSNLNGLLNGQAKGLGVLGAAGQIGYDVVVAPIQITLSTAPASGGQIEFYFLVTEDPVNIPWTDGISPTATSDQSALVRMARRIRQPMNVVTGLSTVYVFDSFSYFAEIGFWPMFYSILCWNRSGVAFASSGHIAQYSQQNHVNPPVQYA